MTYIYSEIKIFITFEERILSPNPFRVFARALCSIYGQKKPLKSEGYTSGGSLVRKKHVQKYVFAALCRFRQKEISEIDNNSDRFKY